jgi:uncharacterized membrane protein SpoIIM required for sporulation
MDDDRKMLRFWHGFPSKIKRILTIIFFFLLSVIITVAGTVTPLSSEDAASLGRGLEDTQNKVESLTPDQKASFIFGNNFMICLIGFVPVFGPIFEGYVLYSTGVVLNAYATYKQAQVSPTLLFFSLFLFPFTWLEFLAYSIAIAGSFWLTWRIIKRKFRMEIKNTCILMSMSAVILLTAAIIEAALIGLQQGAT